MATDNYKPLAAYGLIGNLETCALVGTDGSIDWCCLPHLASASVFGALLDTAKGGRFRIQPSGPYEMAQRYRPRTNVLETEFTTESGVAVLTDFMPMLSDDPVAPFAEPWIYRRATCEEGTVSVDITFEPRFDYARARTTVEPTDDGVIARGNGEHLSLGTDGPIATDRNSANGTHQLESGETRWYTLQYGLRKRPSSVDVDTVLEQTVDFWRNWVHECATDGGCLFGDRYHDAVVRSELTLKLLMHRMTGAIAAAPTTSLPETIGGSRNWDYRFSWIRDAAFTVQAFDTLGHSREAWKYFDWCLDIVQRESGSNQPFQPLYGLHGETEVTEEVLEHLSGYRKSVPVRIGNAASNQLQLDVYGELVLALSEISRAGATITDPAWRTIRDIVEAVCGMWSRTDTGMWEIRSGPEHYVHSKVMCWAAVDRGIEMARNRDADVPIDRWRDVGLEIRNAVLERGYNDSIGSFVRSFEADDALDAATLRIPLVGFLPFDDYRIQGTIDAIRERLTTDRGLVYRYEGEDGIPSEEGAFLLCSCWLVDCLAMSGQVDEAEAILETVLDCATPLGLLAEEVDPESGELRGNFPQAFSHHGIINSVLYVRAARGEDERLDAHVIGSSAQ